MVARAIEFENAVAGPSFAGMLTVQIVLCPKTVEILGTEEQKRPLLPRSASGERLMAYSQSEPSGAANIASTTRQTDAMPAPDTPYSGEV